MSVHFVMLGMVGAISMRIALCTFIQISRLTKRFNGRVVRLCFTLSLFNFQPFRRAAERWR
jgi:hypothetical protein